MKKFRFNLEAVRRLAHLREEEKKKRLAEANQRLLMAQEELGRLGKEFDDAQASETERRETAMNVHLMRLYVQYVFDLKNRIEIQKQKVLDASRVVKAALDELVEAKRKVKAIERLKEKQKEQWKKERNRYETKVLDDLCQQQYQRLHAEEAA